MRTIRKLPFFLRPQIQLLLLAIACYVWGEFYASRESFITDEALHWYWPHVYVYMIAVFLVEAFIYRIVSRILCWPWLSYVHVGSMCLFAGVMWAIEISGDVPHLRMNPLSFTMKCLSEYLLLAGHLAFFANISIGIIMRMRKAG